MGMGAEAAEGGGADANGEDGQEEEEEELWVPDDLVVMPCHAMQCRAVPCHAMACKGGLDNRGTAGHATPTAIDSPIAQRYGRSTVEALFHRR